MPHLNAALVKAIVDARPFPSITELDAVLSKSLKREQITELYGRLFVHLNLNTATREQILLIPNTGPRMAHGCGIRGWASRSCYIRAGTAIPIRSSARVSCERKYATPAARQRFRSASSSLRMGER